MKVKKIMMVSILLLAILAIGAVSASEDVDTLVVEDDDGLSVDESSDIVTDGESYESLEDMSIFINGDSYSTTQAEDNSVINIEAPIDSNGTLVVSSGDKEFYNKNFNEIPHVWEDTSRGVKGFWINNDELGFFNGLSSDDIVKISIISATSQTYSNFGKITLEDDTFRLEYLFDTWNWARGYEPLYLDTDDTVVNVHIMDPATEGTFYVSANGREYKYVPYYNEWGDAWHNWKLISFDITEAGQYPVVVRYAPDDSSPHDIIGYGILNVIKFNNDAFRANIDTHNNINLFCPDGSEGTVSIFMKNDWGDEYPAQATETYIITSNDYNTWKTWNLADLGCEKENEYIFKIVITGDDFNDIVLLEDKSIWYNDPWDVYITPEITLDVFDTQFEGERDDDNDILGLFIPEKTNIYEGTLEIRNGDTVIYSKELTTADMEFDDNSRDYRYWLKYRYVKDILVNYDNAALTFSFNYNNTQIAQPLVVVKVINKRNYEIELERAFNVGIYNADWGRSHLYLDYNGDVVNIEVRNPAASGIFYVTANGKEYQYQANFDDEGHAWHNWVLSSFDITEADSYHVTIEYANDAGSPRITVMEGDLYVVEFNDDAFRITENRPAQVFNFFCPEGSEGSVISIFLEDDWGDEHPDNIMTITIGSGNCGEWFNLSYVDIGLKWDEENIVLIKILDGNTELINTYETSIWYDYDPYEPFIPSGLLVNINGDDFRSENDEDILIDLYIPEKLLIYSGAVTITSNGRTLYSKDITLQDLEFDDNGRFYQLRIEFGELRLDGLNSGDVVKFAFTNDVKNIEKSVFYAIHHDEGDEYVTFRLINFKDGNFLDNDVLIEVVDFPEGIDDEFKILVDKWGDEIELPFKISELERNEEGLYIWTCSQLDIEDFMEDMTDAYLRFIFQFSNDDEIEGHCWVYKDPCISWGEFGNTDEEPVIDFIFLPDEFEGNIIIRVNGEIKFIFNSREDMDRYHYGSDSEDEDDEGREGWSFGLKDLGLYKEYGTYNISVEMTKNGKQVYYNNTIELVDYVVDARTNLDQITSAVFRILLDDDALGNVTIYVDGVQVFKNTLEWIGYSSWNRMGGFNIPLNYLQITESGAHDVRLEIEAIDDRNEVMVRTINHHIDVEVAPNNIAFGDIIYLFREGNFLYPTILKSPVPLDAEFILYLNGVEAGSMRIECDDFMFRDIDASLLDEYGALRPGVYTAEIRQVSEQGNVTYTGSFEVKTSSGDIEVIVPATVTTIDGVNVAFNAPRPLEMEIDSTGLTIFIDPYLNEYGDLDFKDIIEMWGWELVDFLEDNQYIVLDSLSAGTHKILVQYMNDGDDGDNALRNPFFSGVFTVNVKKVATQITASAVTATYKATKNLVMTLKDANGRILAGKKVTVKVGTLTKTLTTNSKGQISVDVSSLVPKNSYQATIKFAGDGTYLASTKTVKVIVNKAKTKLTAKKVKVKVSAKTKKVTAILKFNTKKLLKSKYVTLKINKKTYKVKTNSKGKAVFKVKNLNKKGTFTGTIKFKGDKYFKASSCKVKVIVK